jgi:mannose/fructose/N-acetylgalactosamine-specific phosphotransferase system component IIC
MINASYGAAGLLVLLGLGMVTATGSPTAAIPSVFGVVLLLITRFWQRRPASRGWALSAIAVGVLTLIAPIGNLARVGAEALLPLTAAAFANLTMALIAAGYLLALWLRRSAR